MRIAVPREGSPGERRVALVPESVRRLLRRELEVAVEAGAGAGAFFDDAAYESAGAVIVGDRPELLRAADVVVMIDPPGPEEIGRLRAGIVLVCVLNPEVNTDIVRALGLRGITSFALDAMPRITRAQSMDVRSSQSTVAGYKAVLLAAEAMAKMMPMMMTAAGTIRPARALVIGAG
ncbi:MAG TPA: NAD(P)(+) transhydrogenase (Re/Si-specific) subunit alpha, partial [Phycisphaerae bacterium]|nr:NAD(P)(+) transhydrogenase (Re/Si-specific) subunit alpha [Phycisphaerae bacterium]